MEIKLIKPVALIQKTIFKGWTNGRDIGRAAEQKEKAELCHHNS